MTTAKKPARRTAPEDDALDDADAAPPARGHNSVDSTTAKRLKDIVERIEKLQEEKKALQEDITDIFTEAKSHGFDVKAIREILRRRKIDRMEFEEFQDIVDTYAVALGMV